MVAVDRRAARLPKSRRLWSLTLPVRGPRFSPAFGRPVEERTIMNEFAENLGYLVIMIVAVVGVMGLFEHVSDKVRWYYLAWKHRRKS
jgi:hypothetical protein